ncbi:hypothetical protein C1H76_1212 [Elsinoe australis]|uniref:Synembryn-like protein n=1 Tax=Elsinoe australis TaxID=40998 RepID=A0A4U7BAF2_9PEZI|nr:hypothetical protein C1H76_1212 [Elsinoe australis]
MATGAEKAKSLLSSLEADFKENRLSDDERAKLLEQLKVIGRDPSQAAPIFAKEGTETLCKFAFETGISSASREAMRCLANAMLLWNPTRQTVIDLDCPSKAAERMKNDDRDDEFLTSRIIFFATYAEKLDIPVLFEKHNIGQSIISNLERAAKRLESGAPSTPITDLAFQETLKLVYNLTYHSPESTTYLRGALQPLTTLLLKTHLPSPPLQPPTTLLINALLNLNPSPQQIEDATIRDPLFPPSEPTALTTHLISILDASFPQTITAKEDPLLTPITSLLRNLHATAPHPDIKASMCASLLPTEESRDQPLGKDATLPSRLIRAAASPTTSALRDIVSALLFALSDSSARTLIRNIGYGYAVGILAHLGVEVGAGDMTGAEGEATGVDINPITGQRRDKEADLEKVQREIDSMTEEEKEREAERLFVLFERLKATGVVDVKNPVEVAREEGRFEEVD